MKKYSLAFIFNHDLSEVLLVKKKRPEWQKGKLNGVGGKFETGEDGLACIVREVYEETGVMIPGEEYISLGTMGTDEWYVYVYCVRLNEMCDFSGGVEDVIWCKVSQLPPNIISNLSWLVPFAVDKLTFKEIKSLEVIFA